MCEQGFGWTGQQGTRRKLRGAFALDVRAVSCGLLPASRQSVQSSAAAAAAMQGCSRGVIVLHGWYERYAGAAGVLRRGRGGGRGTNSVGQAGLTAWTCTSNNRVLANV